MSRIQKVTCSLFKESHTNPGRMDSCLAPTVNLYRQVHSNKNALENGHQEPSEVVCHSFLLNAQNAIIALTGSTFIYVQKWKSSYSLNFFNLSELRDKLG